MVYGRRLNRAISSGPVMGRIVTPSGDVCHADSFPASCAGVGEEEGATVQDGVVGQAPGAWCEDGVAAEQRDAGADGQRGELDDQLVDLGVEGTGQGAAADHPDVLAVVPLELSYRGDRVVVDDLDGRVRAGAQRAGEHQVAQVRVRVGHAGLQPHLVRVAPFQARCRTGCPRR